MALNTFWKIEDLELINEDSYWKSEGFFEGIGTNKKAFEERYRLNQNRGKEEDDERVPLKGIIFNNRWRVSIINVRGMKFKTCNCPES